MATPQDRPEGAPGRGRALVIGGAALFFAAYAWRYRSYLIDDAYISLRYARNLVEGNGLAFNIGERVEGYTNFLWTLLGAAGMAVGLDGMLVWKSLSVLATLGILYLTPRLLSQPSAFPAVVWLLGLEAFAYWSTSGMESTAFSGLFVLAAWLAIREASSGRRHHSVWVCAALVLFRPEGPLVCALTRIAVWLFLECPEPEKRWRALRRHSVDGLAVAAVLGAHIAWRLSFYGHPLPNTYYAKVTGGPEQWNNGLIGLGQWALSQPVFALCLVAPLALLPRWRQHRRLLALWSMAAGWAVYVVSVGGDFMPFFRFFLPVMPILAAVASGLLALLPRRQLAAGVGLLLAQMVAGSLDEQSYRAFVAHRTTTVGLEVGEHLRRLEADALIAVNTAGAVPYASRRPALDMLGLTDAAIARHPVYVVSPLWAGHRRGWGAYVRARRPQAVLWYNAAGLSEPHYLGDHQLADDPYFRFFYQQKTDLLEPDAPDRILARFRGAPFGEPAGPSEHPGRHRAPDLGLSFEIRGDGATRRTAAREDSIQLVYFELRNDAAQLWPLVPEASDPHTTPNVDGLLSAARAEWRRQFAPGDPAARRAVHDLCEKARRAVVRGDLPAAKRLLSTAAASNGAARSPLVYQYVANLAAMEKDLFLAVQAQREALRLDPENDLYVRNLRSLLLTPYDEFKAAGEPSR